MKYKIVFGLTLLICGIISVDWIVDLSFIGHFLNSAQSIAYSNCQNPSLGFPPFIPCSMFLISQTLIFKIATALMLLSSIRFLLSRDK